MTQKRNKPKRTTPEMSAEYRLKKWMANECPYCGGNISSRKKTSKISGGKSTGIHFKCLNPKCRAENTFRNKKYLELLNAEGGE